MIIRVFLASSCELLQERKLIASWVTKLNYLLDEYDITIQLVKWEYLDSSMGIQHKQQDYNDQLRQCDACVVLFWNLCGKYTQIELNMAYQMCHSESNAKRLIVLFKESGQRSPELEELKARYESNRSDYTHTFGNDTQLKELFLQMIRSLLPGEVANSISSI